MAWLLLILIISVAALWWTAHHLGANDSRRKSLTRREWSAVSVAVGLIVAVPLLFDAYVRYNVVLEAATIAASGFLVAAIAGRRTFLYAFVTATVLIGVWFLQNRLTSPPNPHPTANDPLFIVAGLLLNGVQFALPSLLLPAIWKQRRAS